MQANMNQTSNFLARLFDNSDSGASERKRKRELDSPLENNDILAGSSIVAYSGSKRIRPDSVQSVNFPENPASLDMSATASKKVSNQASEKADSENASEKASHVTPESAHPPQSVSLPGLLRMTPCAFVEEMILIVRTNLTMRTLIMRSYYSNRWGLWAVR